MMMAPNASVTSQGAVIATRPASEAFRHIDTSGLPYLKPCKYHTYNRCDCRCDRCCHKDRCKLWTCVAAAPLNPYHPNQRMKHPSAPITMLCPGNACTFVTFPFFISGKFTNSGSFQCGSDKCCCSTNHVDCTGTCKIMES